MGRKRPGPHRAFQGVVKSPCFSSIDPVPKGLLLDRSKRLLNEALRAIGRNAYGHLGHLNFGPPNDTAAKSKKCQGLSAPVRGARQRLGMSMIGKIRGRENGHAIEDRKTSLLGFLHLPVPKLEMPPIGLIAILVEVDEDIQSAVELDWWMLVEVRVYFQQAAGQYLVKAPAVKSRVWNEIGDSRKTLEEFNENLGIQEAQESAGIGTEVMLAARRELSLKGV